MLALLLVTRFTHSRLLRTCHSRCRRTIPMRTTRRTLVAARSISLIAFAFGTSAAAMPLLPLSLSHKAGDVPTYHSVYQHIGGGGSEMINVATTIGLRTGLASAVSNSVLLNAALQSDTYDRPLFFPGGDYYFGVDSVNDGV